MKMIKVFLLLIIPFFINAQIALNDGIGSSHQQKVRSLILLNSVSNIDDYSFGSSIFYDTVYYKISCNAYRGGDFLKEKVYFQFDRIHVFAGMNTANQVYSHLLNYDKNVLTVISADNDSIVNQLIHHKFDFAVRSCGVANGCKNSWASGYAVGLIDRFLVSQGVTGAGLKAGVVNSCTNLILDTNLLSKQEITVDSVNYTQNYTQNLSFDSFCDSVRFTIFYFDRNDKENNLIDTLIINNEKCIKNIYTKTVANQQNITVNISSELCDSSFTLYDINPVHDTILDTVTVVLISDTTAIVFKDSIRGSYENDDKNIRFGRGWKYGDTIRILSFQNIAFFDTIVLYRNWRKFAGYDTVYHNFQNIIHFGISAICFNETSVLPVELSHFNASQFQDFITLNWQTLSEQNNKGFEIERSINATDWKKIGFIHGYSNSIEPIQYRFDDKSLSQSGLYYYRLKQIDFDGSFEYSQVDIVDYSNIELLSNVSENTLYLRGNGTIRIINSIGQTIEIMSIDGLTSIDISNYSPGIYFVSAGDKVQKFIK